ncbi:MAG: TlpA family protein disulfide reductase [Acidobacteriia bacterium]|nr:TlpA family protein disulfide reductase [Terriglobia bacterium]
MIGKLSLAAFLAFAPVATAQPLAGRWDASVNVNGVDVPFRFELAGEGANIKGSFFNGDERLTSTAGRLENGSLALSWDYFASRLEATFKDGALDGKYIQARRSERANYAFHARRYEARRSAPDAPLIAGLWTIPNDSAKGERAWRFIVHQSGPDVSAAILRVDGDTGALTGTYQDGKFTLSHFSGVRPLLLELTPAQDGSLDILQNGSKKLTAVRAEQARARGVPDPADPTRHTSVKDPSDPFRFSFPDLDGHLVSNTDARFRGKVVLINITGSWCPNCHDEAPFLAALYRKYRDQGLEIVALSFEEADQLKDPTRLRAFIKKYGIEYTVLLGGEPSEASEKLTQAVNWNSWPTTFFLGRDGRVRSVHAGFPSSASGELYVQAKEEFTAGVERLLRENIRTAR